MELLRALACVDSEVAGSAVEHDGRGRVWTAEGQDDELGCVICDMCPFPVKHADTGRRHEAVSGQRGGRGWRRQGRDQGCVNPNEIYSRKFPYLAVSIL
eukprot:2157619-Rhodomonas_salina.1